MIDPSRISFETGFDRISSALDRALPAAGESLPCKCLGSNRASGMQVGAGILLPEVHVTWPHQVSLGAGCTLEHNIYFNFDGIWAPRPSIIVGDRVFIGFGFEFNVRRRVDVGADCLIASGCKVIDQIMTAFVGRFR